MIIEVSSNDLRDIAAAVHAARKRDLEGDALGPLQQKVLGAIQRREETIELSDDEATALREALLQRAYDQRNTSEGMDYADLADRLERALDTNTDSLRDSLEAPSRED